MSGLGLIKTIKKYEISHGSLAVYKNKNRSLRDTKWERIRIKTVYREYRICFGKMR